MYVVLKSFSCDLSCSPCLVRPMLQYSWMLSWCWLWLNVCCRSAGEGARPVRAAERGWTHRLQRRADIIRSQWSNKWSLPGWWCWPSSTTADWRWLDHHGRAEPNWPTSTTSRNLWWCLTLAFPLCQYVSLVEFSFSSPVNCYVGRVDSPVHSGLDMRCINYWNWLIFSLWLSVCNNYMVITFDITDKIAAVLSCNKQNYCIYS